MTRSKELECYKKALKHFEENKDQDVWDKVTGGMCGYFSSFLSIDVFSRTEMSMKLPRLYNKAPQGWIDDPYTNQYWFPKYDYYPRIKLLKTIIKEMEDEIQNQTR